MTALQIANDTTDSAKRQQILDGARRCFLAQGFDASSMNEIVKAAGVSKGTVYAYFSSKEKLFEALIFQDRRNQAERAVVIEDESRPIEKVLHDLALRMATMFKTPETVAYVRLVVAVAEKFPEIGRAFYAAGPDYANKIIAGYLKRKMDDGTLRQGDPNLCAMQFCELVQCGLMKPRLFAAEAMAGTFEIEYVIESGVSLFLGGLKRQN
jgi:AcrR family transcriptional regulator